MSEAGDSNGDSGNGRRLPRGRHSLSRSAVKANQRERLLDATTEALAEHGYTALTVDHVIEGAGVSRATFYEQFEDKHKCVLAAHELAFERLSEVIATACASGGSWPEKVAAAIGASLEFAAKSPNQARLVVETYPAASDPVLAGHGMATHRHLAALLREGHERDHGGEPQSPITERAVIGATMSVVGARLMSGEADSLLELKSELVQLVLSPYIGAEEARRIAGGKNDHSGALEAHI